MNNGPSFFARTLRQSRIGRSRTLAYSNRDRCQVLGSRLERRGGARRPTRKIMETKQILVSVLPGGLLYGDVAGRAELRDNVNGSVVVDVHVPGAVGRPKDRERTVDAGIFAVVTADRDVPT